MLANALPVGLLSFLDRKLTLTTSLISSSQAVMKEAMRLSPGVSMPLERFVPPEGAIICGQHLRGGTIVGMNPAVVHRDETVFKDANKFSPERWISCTESEARAMDRSLLTVSPSSLS